MIKEKIKFIWKNAELKGKNPEALDSTPEEFIDQAISQIKALVIESLGEKREVNISCDCGCIGFTGECDCDKDFGYNQHIAEMKEKWK